MLELNIFICKHFPATRICLTTITTILHDRTNLHYLSMPLIPMEAEKTETGVACRHLPYISSLTLHANITEEGYLRYEA